MNFPFPSRLGGTRGADDDGFFIFSDFCFSILDSSAFAFASRSATADSERSGTDELPDVLREFDAVTVRPLKPVFLKY